MARPILPWRSPLAVWPPDGSEVWIRRLPWYDQPVRASFRFDDRNFTVSVPLAGTQDSYDYAVTIERVHTWKFQFLADEQAAFPPS
jgi:hypothetical protein